MKVTADTITDEQIHELRERSAEYGDGMRIDGDYMSAAAALNVCDESLGELDYGDIELSAVTLATRRLWARTTCAAAWNARFGRVL